MITINLKYADLGMNALLNLNDIPAFDKFSAQEIKPAINQAMNEARQSLDNIKRQPEISWNNIIEPLTDLSERVGRIWGVVSHIHSVADSSQWRQAYNDMLPIVTNFFTEISQDTTLFDLFEKIRNSDEYNTLSDSQQKKLNNDLRDFVLSGVKLPKPQQEELAKLQQESAALSASFSQNVLDATDAFSLHINDINELSGLPESALEMFQAAAREKNQTGYTIGLQAPHYLSIMRYADNRQLREKIYRAYITRASELDDKTRDNHDNINKILSVAAKESSLLGFANAAELSLATKMANSPQQVIDFLQDIAQRAKPFAQKDLDELKQFAIKDGIDSLQAWDIAYYSEKLREQKYSFSEEEVRNYFPISKVLTGLFQLIKSLYNVEFEEEKRPVWNTHVKYFNLLSNQHNIGGIYIDLYARQGKKGGAWMNDYCGRRKFPKGDMQLPQAYVVCNFIPPNEQGEAYLSHDEVLTLFHETGHALHHLLTQVDELGVSGISGVEWDAVELPSQFMENFAWEYDVLADMSCHKTNQFRLPETLFQQMKAAKNFQTGMFVVRQMEFALFDMIIYQQTQQPCDWEQILQSVRKQVAVVPIIPENRFAHSFSHIFAGGYSAGYYSYIWAEVLSADAYDAFIEENDRAKTGQRFWQEILSRGGSRNADENFRAFRGREPKPDALLKHLGLN